MLYSPTIAVAFMDVVKEYHLYRREWHRLLPKTFESEMKIVRANNKLDFTVYRGESVALVGKNGAGKSTILKLITGVSYPTSGEVYINGRVSALLDLTAGFDMGLTGRENIELRGLIWGFEKEEMDALTPEIIEFANIGSYIDQPMRSYSSGMKARLGFAFASSIDADILIIDETLAVGDREFTLKCLERVRNILSEKNKTVLFVTHSNRMAQEFCKRGLVINEGKLLFDGYIDDAIQFYEEQESETIRN